MIIENEKVKWPLRKIKRFDDKEGLNAILCSRNLITGFLKCSR